MTVVGAVARPQSSPEQLREAALAADRVGIPELWLWEDCFREGGISSSAALLGSTERVRIGIGVLPFPLRNAALTAMELATLERMFPGRFLPGLGHGVQRWMEQVGARPRSVLTLEREYVTALRALLAGDEVSVEGDYVRLRGVRLDWPPASVPPLFLAATGPRSIELAGELGDGVILDESTPLGELPSALELLDRGAASAGRPRPEVVVFVPADARDAAAAVDLVHAWAEGGADRVILQTSGDDPDPVGYVRFVADEVAPEFSLAAG